jgi:hypothetical protein
VLIPSEIPEGGADLVMRNAPHAPSAPLVALVEKVAPAADLLEKAPPARVPTLQIALPHPLYTAKIGDLDGKFLASARRTAWQYVVVEGESPHSVAETRWRASTGSLVYAARYSRGYAEEMVRTIGTAEALPEVAAADYELRILRAPSLSLLAVWLHGPKDLILLIRRAPATLKDNVLITESELTAALRPLAEQRQNVSDRG